MTKTNNKLGVVLTIPDNEKKNIVRMGNKYDASGGLKKLGFYIEIDIPMAIEDIQALAVEVEKLYGVKLMDCRVEITGYELNDDLTTILYNEGIRLEETANFEDIKIIDSIYKEKLENRNNLIVDEWCQNCENEVELVNEFVRQACPNCGATILPCSLCVDCTSGDKVGCVIDRLESSRKDKMKLLADSSGIMLFPIKGRVASLNEANGSVVVKGTNGEGAVTFLVDELL